MFSILYGTYFSFYMHCKMSSAICFNLDQSKIMHIFSRILLANTSLYPLFVVSNSQCKREGLVAAGDLRLSRTGSPTPIVGASLICKGLYFQASPHYHTIPHFDTLQKCNCGKHCEKRRNCLKQAISPFLTMFSTLHVTFFSQF